MTNQDLVTRLRTRSEIRRQIPTRKSVQENKPDRIADLLEEAAVAIEQLRLQIKYLEKGLRMLEQEQFPTRSYEIYDRAEIESNFQHVSTFGVEQEDNSTGQFTGGIYSRTFLLTNVEYEFVFEKEKAIMLSITFKGLQNAHES